MSTDVIEAGSAKNVTSTTTIAGDGKLIGFYVNSTTAGTIAFSSGDQGTLSGTITPLIGFHRFPCAYSGILTATIGGTLNVTIFTVGGVA